MYRFCHNGFSMAAHAASSSAMASIERIALEKPLQRPWLALVARAVSWASTNEIALRDAVVIVPFAQLLAPARAAFSTALGAAAWSPRIETTQTLAASLAPPAVPEPGQVGFDPAIDRLAAARLLRAQTWGAAWARRDPRGFDTATTELVAAAHAIGRAAASVAPSERAAYWAEARRVLAPISGPGAEEQLLARVALEWASVGAPVATDRLFALKPSAWIIVQAGGADALCVNLIAAADASACRTPCLWLDTDADDDAPFASPAQAPTIAVCDDFEAEAEATAAQILAHIHAGRWPIALVAEDRLLVRRVRALLDRHRLQLHDETGWKLSTTRAAAQLIGLFESSQPGAAMDAVLDWLKSGVRWPSKATAASTDAAVAALEAHCRRHHLGRVDAVNAALRDGPLAHWWAGLAALLAAFAAQPRQPLAAWLGTLADTLAGCGLWNALLADDAGRQVLAALRLDAARSGAQGAGATPMSLAEFDAWVRWVLEHESYVPTTREPGEAQVIVTPLARVMLRPFAAVVLPGADDKHLGSAGKPHPLFTDAQAATLGIATAAERQRTALQCFVHALALPHVSLLRRRLDGAEPLAASPWVERLGLALAQRGDALHTWQDPRVPTTLPATPIYCSSPAAPQLLPARLSASTLEALRACPYRFFALHLLRLREEDELDGEIEKRDFGTWLHAVLYRFHLDRGAPAAAPIELQRLQDAASAAQAELGFDAAEFLPFAASFADFAPRYIAWLHERDAAGAQWQQGEHNVTIEPAALDGLALHGVIDRIDRVRSAAGPALQLIDYKTGSVAQLEAKVRDPLEDTQLAFYAALMLDQAGLPTASAADAPLTAAYLALDSRKGIGEIEHPDVGQSAVALLDGVAVDFSRLRAGAGLPALGAGSSCDYCAARGICRRDHWSAEDGAVDSGKVDNGAVDVRAAA